MTQATAAAAARPARQRDIAIDTLRGVAIVLMVAGHVIGGTGYDGLRVAEDSAWRQSYDLLSDIRMPLFTALSGFVYGLRPLRDLSRYTGFVWAKVRRLLVPLTTVGTLFVLLQSLAPGTNSDTSAGDLWRVYVFGLGHFWFLQAIFLIFLTVGIADAFGWLRDRTALLGVITIAAFVSTLVTVPDDWDVFSINGFLRLLPFFLVGRLFAVHLRADRGPWRWVLLASAVVLFFARSAVVFMWMPVSRVGDVILGVALGLAAVSSLLAFRSVIKWYPLAWLGRFSFAIYLLHVFGTAPARMLLTRIGVESEPIVFCVALAAGLLLPVLFEVTCGRIRWVSWALLGQKPFRALAR